MMKSIGEQGSRNILGIRSARPLLEKLEGEDIV